MLDRKEVKHEKSGKEIHEEFEDEYSYFLEAFREEDDFWEEVEKKGKLVTAGEVVEAATVNVGPNLQGEGLLERRTTARTVELLTNWDSEEAKEERRQQFSDTGDAFAWVNFSQESIDDEWSKLASEMEDEVLEKYRRMKDTDLGARNASHAVDRLHHILHVFAQE